MAYLHLCQNLDMNAKDRERMLAEFDSLRNELNDIRTKYAAELSDLHTKYAALVAKLDADAGVTDADYAATVGLAAASTLAAARWNRLTAST